MIELLPVKPYRENFHGGCGPASLKMVLDYYGIKKLEKEIFKLCKTRKDTGTPAENIKKAAESFGLKVKIKDNSSFKDIEYWLGRKVPVIVDWFTRGRIDYDESEVADGHYSVVAGLDKKYIYLQDPELGGLRKIKKEDFMIVWFDFKGKYIRKDELVIRQIIAIYRQNMV